MSVDNSEQLYSQAQIANPNTNPKPYYCTETQWREQTGFTNKHDFPSDEILRHLKNATEKIRKDGFHMIRWELTSKDSEGRYFTAKNFWANKYGRDNISEKIICGQVQKYDIEVYEGDTGSSFTSNLWLQGRHINRLMTKIPYEAITEIDPLNGYFKLSDDYPRDSNKQIFVTYWIAGKPLDELEYELKMACIEYTTILALKKLKTKRLKKGTVQYTLGKQTIVRNEETFDKMIEDHKKEYYSWIRWLKPFIGRRVKIGRLETRRSMRFINRY